MYSRKQVGHAGLPERTPPLELFRRTSSFEVIQAYSIIGVAWTTSARVSDPGRLVPLTRAAARDLVCEPIAAGPGRSLAGN